MSELHPPSRGARQRPAKRVARSALSLNLEPWTLNPRAKRAMTEPTAQTAPSIAHQPEPEVIDPVVADASAPAEPPSAPDQTPQEGDPLDPGDYLVEVASSTPMRREILSAGLQRAGFSEVWHDQSRARGDAAFAVREHRFVGRLTRPIQVHHQPRIRWTFVRQLATDALCEVKDLRHRHVAFDLVPHMVYEAVFLSSPPPPTLRGIPLRQVVEQTLNEMGFIPHKLAALRRDVPTAPGPKGQTVTLWFGFLEWDGPQGITTDEDPFYFEHLTQLA